MVVLVPISLFTRVRFRYLLALGSIAFPIVLIAVIKWETLPTLISFFTSVQSDYAPLGSSVVGGVGDSLKISMLLLSPFLGFLNIMLNNSLTFFFLLGSIPFQLFFYLYLRRRDTSSSSSVVSSDTGEKKNRFDVFGGPYLWLIVNVIWFVSAGLLSPYSDVAWRFAEYALAPSIFLVAGGSSLIAVPLWRKAVRMRTIRRGNLKVRKGVPVFWARMLVVLFLSGIICAYSFPWIVYPDLAVEVEEERLIENSIGDSFVWINSEIPEGNFLAITDWRFSFLNGFGSSTGSKWTVHVPLANSPIRLDPNEVYGLNEISTVNFVIVTIGIYLVSSGESLNLVEAFQSDQRFGQVYSNEIVYIFELYN